MGVKEDSLDRLAARNLDRDDVVTSTLSSFAAMTVGCARCHDHKFDPITQADYYALQAVFAGIDKAERPYDADPAVAQRRAALTAESAKVRALAGKADPELLTAAREAEVLAFEKAAGTGPSWEVPVPDAASSKHGSALKIMPDRSVLASGPRPERDTYTVVIPSNSTGLTGLRLEVLADDSLPLHGPGRQDNGNLHLSEVRVTVQPKGQPGRAVPVKLTGAVADFNQAEWGIHRAIDGQPGTAWGIYPEVGKSHWASFGFERPVGFEGGSTVTVELDQLHGGGHLIGRLRLSLTTAPVNPAETPIIPAIADFLKVAAANRTPAQKAELARWVWERRVTRELAALPPQTKVYTGTHAHNVDGTFRPAPPARPVYLLKRGEITRPGKEVAPGAVAAVPARFTLSGPNDEGQRRAALAHWLTDPANPLPYRVMANRVWHYHFGKGIVDTPNDFGRMGGPPSHPQLLDWLACELRDNGGSLKKLHRLIVSSQAYRQSSRHDEASAAVDGDNRLLWRMNRTRLDAETVRDAVLLASGRLDGTMYGPPEMHFLMSPGVHVTPVLDYEKFDVDKPGAGRRGIYRFVFRTVPDPLLEALDCPDASQSAPTRTASVSALQALALWNNKFTLRHAEHLAALAATKSPELGGQVRAMALRVLGREPTAAEAAVWEAFARKHGAASLGRVLLNCSEFLFVD